MSKLIAVRLQDKLLSQIDKERKRTGHSRAGAIHEALALWIARRHYDRAVSRDQEGYDRHPVTEDEFEAILGAQRWPK